MGRIDGTGASRLASRNAAKRSPIPDLVAIRPRSGRLPSRRVSSMPKRRSVPNASRGVVHTQFGLPRPALSIGAWLSRSASEASSISLSFSSKGLSFRSVFCSARVVAAFFVLVAIVRSLLDLVSLYRDRDCRSSAARLVVTTAAG